MDSTRLFEPSRRPLLRPPGTPQTKGQARPDDTKSIAELLDEISNSPPSTIPYDDPPSPTSDTHFLPPRPNPQPPQPVSNSADFDLETLNLSSRPRPTHYDTEMDWSPTQSKHRAFNNLGQRTEQAGTGFNQAPTEPPRGAFWYKVPPAPTTPAQRIFNPPNQPRLRKSPVASTGDTTFGAALRGTSADGSGGATRLGQPLSQETLGSGVNFRQPRIFAPERGNDPRDTLSGLLGESLSFSQEEREREREEMQKRSWWGGLMGKRNAS